MGVDLAETPTKTHEAERTDFKVRIHKNDIPWLPEEQHDVHLVRMRLGKGEFLFGSAVKGKTLVSAAEQMDNQKSEKANRMLYSHLPLFAEGYNPNVVMVKNPATRQPIFYLKSNTGARVYFMRFGKIDNMPVIVKIAACNKAQEAKVMGAITSESRMERRMRM